MKTFLSHYCLIICLFYFISSDAQTVRNPKPEKNIPAAVLENFSRKFPSHDPVWFSQYQGKYNQKLVFEGRFIFDNRYSTAVYDDNGNLIAFAATIDKAEIPDSIIRYMNENYPTYPISESLLVTRQQNDQTYEVGIYIDGQYVIMVFSKNGDFIRSTRA